MGKNRSLKRKMMILLLTVILLTAWIQPITNGATAFQTGSIQPDDLQDIEIIENIVKINEKESSVSNTFLLKNTSRKEKETTLKLPIENSSIISKVKDLVIKINNQEVEYTKTNDGMHKIQTVIPANSYKKIDITYNTEDNLRDAKVIKYSLDNWIGKTIKKIKVDVVLDSTDIPLVNAIYPQFYEFSDNTISMEYYNAKINNLTKDFIVSKNTYNNLKYGRDTELSDSDKKVLDKVDEMDKNGIKINYSELEHLSDYYVETAILKAIIGNEDMNEIKSNDCEDIIYYYMLKQLAKDSKENQFAVYQSFENKPLIEDFIRKTSFQYYDYIENKYKTCEKTLLNKKICIDYVETEGDKELYVYKNTKGSEEPKIEDFQYVKTPEIEILQKKDKTYGVTYDTKGAQIIYVGKGTEGEDLGATEQEKIEYINMIGADLYVRVMIYDNKVENTKKAVGYYNSNDYEMAIAYGTTDYYHAVKEDTVQLSNENVVNYCKIPTVAQFVGYRVQKEGKYVVEFYGGGYFRGTYTRNK